MSRENPHAPMEEEKPQFTALEKEMLSALRMAIVFLNSLHLPVGTLLAYQNAYDECRKTIRDVIAKAEKQS